MASDVRRNIVIIGGGVIGSTSAYYLTRHPSFNPAIHTITLLEASSIAGGSSGKAGGLLALWAYPSSIVPLSFRLHAELAAEHDGPKRWGYRRLYCGTLELKAGQLSRKIKGQGGEGVAEGPGEENWSKLPKQDREAAKMLKAAGIPDELDWFDGNAMKSYSALGDTSNTAQVHPYQFTTSMADLAVEKGAKIILGSVTEIQYTEDKSGVKGVVYEDKETKEKVELPATDIIVAAGPWTSRVLPDAPIAHTRAHSVLIKADVSPYAVFSEIELPEKFGERPRRHGRLVSPEMYARPNGEIYACGEGDHDVPLPATTADVEVDLERCQDIIDYCASVSEVMASADVPVKQACYLPNVVGSSAPLVGPTATKGLFVAAGHTVWGINNSAATGKLVSELVWDGKAKSASIKGLDPKNYM